MFDYITVKDMVLKWGISERRIQKLCGEDRIPDVVQLGHSWIIPQSAQKSEDMQRKRMKGECGHAQAD